MCLTVSRRESTVSTTTQVSQQQPPVYPQQMLEQNTANLHPPFSYSISSTPSGINAPSHEMQVDAVRGAAVQATGAPTYSNGTTYGSSQPLAQPGQAAQLTQSDDMRYWNNMFRDLGFGEAVDQTYAGQNVSNASASSPHHSAHQHPQSHHNGIGCGRGTGHQPYAYHHMHSNAPGYGL
jgi:hypothetical protein